MKLKTEFDNSEKASVKVTVHKNHLQKTNDTYAKVVRKTASMESIIASVHEKLPMFSESFILALFMEAKKAIGKKLSEGAAVNVFDLGTMYLTAKKEERDNDEEELGNMKVGLGFTVSEYSKNLVSSIKIEEASEEVTSPFIESVTDLFTKKTDSTVSEGKSLSISGKRLKIMGSEDKSGVYFAPVTSEGKMSVDEKTWQKAKALFLNVPGTLSLFLPEEMKKGSKWYIVIRTKYTRGGSLLKGIREGTSSFQVMVV